MARKTVRVDIPEGKPEDLIALGQAIFAKHNKDGAASPLDKDKMIALGAALGIAAPQHQAAKDADGVAQKARQVRDGALGLADGQNVTTPNTVLNLTSYARDQLLIEHEGAEEGLTDYGFNVVVGSAKNPKPRKPKPPTT
jgi:hypothetical protein